MEEIVTRELVPDSQRSGLVNRLFGMHFVAQLEPLIYAIANQFSPDYKGGYWSFYRLSNGGFYMAPRSDEALAVLCPNNFQGVLSADALGIVTCLCAYSHLSFTANPPLNWVYGQHYHMLRDHMLDHAEAVQMYQATD